MDLSLAGISLGVVFGGNSASASFDCIPTELVIAILSKLPIKTILLTTCVCKRWYSIIKTPSFISAQLSNSVSIPTNNYILLSSLFSPPDDEDHNFYIYSDDNHPSLQAKLKIPFQTISKSIHIVGSCNGLVCITDSDSYYRGSDIYLINPFIHKYKKLNPEDSCYSYLLSMGEMKCDVVIGFGYSDVENDYKVVRHFWEFNGGPALSKAEVYSLKSGKWKVIIVDPVSYIDHSCAPLVDCCLYWSRANYLQCFDLNCEVFRKIETPANYNNEQLHRTSTTSIVKLNGSIALIGSTDDRFCIFMMEKDNCEQIQWKEFEYELQPDIIHPEIYISPIGFSGNGRLLFDHNEESPRESYTDDEFDVEGGIEDKNKESVIFKIGVTNLDNLSAVQDITFECGEYYAINISFSASLVFFLD